MKCINCGKELVDDAIFCSFCGRKIEHELQSTISDASQGQSPSEEDSVLDAENMYTRKEASHDNVPDLVDEPLTNDELTKTEFSIKTNNAEKDSKNNGISISTFLVWSFFFVCVLGVIYNVNKITTKSGIDTEYSLNENQDNDEGTVFLKFAIKHVKENLPMDAGDGIICIDCYWKNKDIVYEYELKGIMPEDCTEEQAVLAKKILLKTDNLKNEMTRILQTKGMKYVFNYYNEKKNVYIK